MDKNTITTLTSSFDAIAQQIPEESTEFWYAREIMTALGYDRWENFSKVIYKASIACETAGGEIANHFRGVTKMVAIGSGAERAVAFPGIWEQLHNPAFNPIEFDGIKSQVGCNGGEDEEVGG